jgi:LmbE family N-acetylglucosaminyl deacetylase
MHKPKLYFCILGSLLLVIGLLPIWYAADTLHSDFEAQRISQPHAFNYRIGGTNAIHSMVHVTASGFEVPDRSCEWRSALLRLSVDASWRATYADAFVDILVNGQKRARQYFERPPASEQYINVSVAPEQGSAVLDSIALRGHHISWQSQDADFYTFCNPDLDGKRILVVAPHPDDAEIAAFGLYHAFSENSYIVTVTAGDYGGDPYRPIHATSLDSYRAKGKLRVWDSITVPLIGDVPADRVFNLAYGDATLASMFADPTSSVSPRVVAHEDLDAYRRQNFSSPIQLRDRSSTTWGDLVQDFASLILQIEPDVIVLPHPILDTHPDHKFSTIATLEAMKGLPAREGLFLFYTNHAPITHFYPFGQRDGLIGLPPMPPTQEVSIDQVYSFPLSPETRALKLHALESMHDLRSPRPPFLPNSPRWFRNPGSSLENFVRDLAYGLDVRAVDITYYRRAARPNELFFAHPWSRKDQLHAEFLAFVSQTSR